MDHMTTILQLAVIFYSNVLNFMKNRQKKEPILTRFTVKLKSQKFIYFNLKKILKVKSNF